jgi:hypothetical protein
VRSWLRLAVYNFTRAVLSLRAKKLSKEASIQLADPQAVEEIHEICKLLPSALPKWRPQSRHARIVHVNSLKSLVGDAGTN